MTRLAIIFSLLFVTPAWATTRELSYDAYKDLQKRDPDMVEHYLNGLMAGTTWHQLYSEKNIYCVPNDDINISILKTAIEKTYSINPERFAKAPISTLAIKGLMLIFPCKK